MLCCFAGLQLGLLFIRMSNQVCNSCDQLLEKGELSVARAAPGPVPSPSRMLSVHLSVCLFAVADSVARHFPPYLLTSNSFQGFFFLFFLHLSLGN